MKLVARRTCCSPPALGAAAAGPRRRPARPTTADPAPQARIGAPAPAFTLTDSNGKTVSLADFKGKTVVLEWTNHDCPYVRKHYGGNNMQALQKKWTAQGVVWLTLISSAPGEQGYVSAAEANKLTADRGAAPTAVLFDPKGNVGRAYGAQTTPHMYVITGDGTLVYMGGIDDKPTDAARRPEDRQELRRRGAERGGAGQAGVGDDVAPLRLHHQVFVLTADRHDEARVTRSRRLGEAGFALGEGPVEPGRERRHIGRLDRRAAPDAQRRRRIAMAGDVAGGVLLVEHRLELLDEGALRVDAAAARRPDRRSSGTPRCWSASPDRRRGSPPTACARPSRAARGRWRRRARTAPAGRRCSRPSRARRDSPPRTASTAC